jgi:probable HAF family extracellular repeat protein
MRSLLVTLIAVSLLFGCSGHGQPPLPRTGSPVTVAQGGATAQYTAVALGTLGGSASGGNSINNRGWVAGFSFIAGNGAQHATLWHNGLKIDLGTLGGANSAVEWPVKAENGLISGISETATPDPLGEQFSCAAFIATNGHTCLGFVWRDGVMRALPTLGGNNDYAAGANSRGEIVGWAENTTHDPTCVPPQVLQFEAVIWTPKKGSVRVLPPLSGDVDGAAVAINDKGEVVGISGICDRAVGRFTARHAVLWHDGQPTNIGNLGGAAWNTPAAINNHGDIVGFSDLPGDAGGAPNFHAFLRTRGGDIRDLGTLPGDVYSEALGINDRGQIVGVSYSAGFATSRAFIWQNGVMRDLNASVLPGSTLSLLYAGDINAQGEITGGACVLSNGACSSETTAFLAIPHR